MTVETVIKLIPITTETEAAKSTNTENTWAGYIIAGRQSEMKFTELGTKPFTTKHCCEGNRLLVLFWREAARSLLVLVY